MFSRFIRGVLDVFRGVFKVFRGVFEAFSKVPPSCFSRRIRGLGEVVLTLLTRFGGVFRAFSRLSTPFQGFFSRRFKVFSWVFFQASLRCGRSVQGEAGCFGGFQGFL